MLKKVLFKRVDMRQKNPASGTSHAKPTQGSVSKALYTRRGNQYMFML